MADLNITDLRGGLNNSDPPSALAADQCVEAVNVEFNLSTLGERRRGVTSVTITGDLADMDLVTYLYRHLPSSDEGEAQLWAVGATTNLLTSVFARKATDGWDDVGLSPSGDTPSTGVSLFGMSMASLHGKLFIAFKSAADRLHLCDSPGTPSDVIQRAGIAQPSPPTLSNSGAAGTYAGVRYARIRYVFKDGTTGLTTRRSEPSTSVAFTPDAAHASMRVTRPALSSSEPANAWEVELSLDNANFYRSGAAISDVSTTFDDSTAFGTGYASGVLSEDIGDYSVPHSPKYLAVDADRLIMAGSWDQPNLGSRVLWTPVGAAEGVGNDERWESDTDPFEDLDTYDGGEITGLSNASNGVYYVFKLGRIYQFLRTGHRENAYDVVLLSKVRGAIPGSVVEGVDQQGRPCVYFLDPSVGPCLIGVGGLQTCGGNVLTTWRSVNVLASYMVARGVYYPEVSQLHWFVSITANGSVPFDAPSLRLVLQTDLMRNGDEGMMGGWALATGVSAQTYAVCLFASNIEGGSVPTPVSRNRILRPFLAQGDGIGAATGAAIVRFDETVNTDAGTAYFAHVTTRPYTVGGLLQKFGVRAGTVLAKIASGVSLYVQPIRDYGLETATAIPVSLTPAGSETHVVRPMDNLVLSELYAVQLRIGDDPTSVVPAAGAWEVEQLSLKLRNEESA